MAAEITLRPVGGIFQTVTLTHYSAPVPLNASLIGGVYFRDLLIGELDDETRVPKIKDAYAMDVPWKAVWPLPAMPIWSTVNGSYATEEQRENGESTGYTMPYGFQVNAVVRSTAPGSPGHYKKLLLRVTPLTLIEFDYARPWEPIDGGEILRMVWRVFSNSVYDASNVLLEERDEDGNIISVGAFEPPFQVEIGRAVIVAGRDATFDERLNGSLEYIPHVDPGVYFGMDGVSTGPYAGPFPAIDYEGLPPTLAFPQRAEVRA